MQNKVDYFAVSLAQNQAVIEFQKTVKYARTFDSISFQI